MEMVKVTLTKSLIGTKPNQKATAASLGLRKIGDAIVHEDSAVLAGKVKILGEGVKPSGPAIIHRKEFIKED